MATYKAVMRPALQCASYILWSPLASSTSIKKLPVIQNVALMHTNIPHLHNETITFPIHEHLQLHAPQKTSLTQTYNTLQHSKVKNTLFYNGRYTTNIPTDPHPVTTTHIKTDIRHIHTSIVTRQLAPQEAITNYCAHLRHTLAALKK